MTKDDALKKLNILIEDIEKLKGEGYKEKNTNFLKFENRVERYIKSIFGNNSNYMKKFEDISFISLSFDGNSFFEDNNKVYENRKAYYEGLEETKSLFESIIEEIEEEWEDNINKSYVYNDYGNVKVNIINNNYEKPKDKVFIVHGHDELAIIQVSEIIRKLKLEPIVLRDQASRSSTVIEKIEAYTQDVAFGVILYTECDWGGKEKNELQRRARQNVVLEHGYLMAKIGRENTLALVKGKVEIPGDISGVVYTPMDDYNAWATKLAKELKAAEYKIDLNDLA